MLKESVEFCLYNGIKLLALLSASLVIEVCLDSRDRQELFTSWNDPHITATFISFTFV